MRLLGRRQEPAPPPVPEPATGVCPACTRGSRDTLVFDACGLCGGTGRIPAKRPWTLEDDAVLEANFRSSVHHTAYLLRRPITEIYSRASELGLSRDVGAPAIIVRRGIKTTDAEVNIHDASGFGAP